MPLLNSSNRLSKDHLILTIILLIHLIIIGINANQVDSSSVESRKPTETASQWNFLRFIKNVIKKQQHDPKQKFIQSKISKIETDKNINKTKKLSHIYKSMFEKPYDYNSFFLEKDEADKQYLERFEIYKQSTIDFKPDLFLCDLLNNEACFDVAWKFKLPAVGVSSSLSSK